MITSGWKPLQNSSVLRKGLTHSRWEFEEGTDSLELRISERSATAGGGIEVLLAFDVPSKGGGRTELQVSLGDVDIALLVSELAKTSTTARAVMSRAIAAAEDDAGERLAASAGAVRDGLDWAQQNLTSSQRNQSPLVQALRTAHAALQE